MGTILEQLRKIQMVQAISEQEDNPAGKDSGDGKPALRGIYRCRACGYIFNEELEGKPFSTLTECPVCHVSPGGFMQIR